LIVHVTYCSQGDVSGRKEGYRPDKDQEPGDRAVKVVFREFNYDAKRKMWYVGTSLDEPAEAEDGSYSDDTDDEGAAPRFEHEGETVPLFDWLFARVW